MEKEEIKIKVDLPKDGGILSQVNDDKYPRKGFPEEVMVEFVLPTLKGLIPMITNYGGKVFRKFNIAPERYCPAVRELYRVLTIAADRAVEQHIKDKILGVRDLVCPTLEFDSFYRNIFQNIAEEIDISKLWPDDGDKYFRDLDMGKRYNFKSKP